MSTHNQFFLKKNTYFQDNQETIIYVFIFSYELNAFCQTELWSWCKFVLLLI